jgi:hypothetical protein
MLPTALDRGAILRERYRVDDVLGRGGDAETWAATRLDGGRRVALKVLSLRGLRDWKSLELFEREAAVLGALDHPAIPRFVEAFDEDIAGDRRFVIVEDLVPGETLAAWCASGARADAAELRRMARQLLDVLAYLHARVPPVVHRDVKPSNVIRRPDGRLALVDFGAVQTLVAEATARGSTIIGTLGYMAPEQLRGRVGPGADLYALARTLVFCATGADPSTLPERAQRIDLSALPGLDDPGLRAFLDRAQEPDPDLRFARAEDALAALDAPAPRPASRAAAPLLALVTFVAGASAVAWLRHPPPSPPAPPLAAPSPAAAESTLDDPELPAPVGVFRADAAGAPFAIVALGADGRFLRSKGCGGPADRGRYRLRRLRDARVAKMSRVIAFEDETLHEQIDLFAYALDGTRLRVERVPTHEGFTMTRDAELVLRGAGEPCDPASCAYCAPPLGCDQDRRRCE